MRGSNGLAGRLLQLTGRLDLDCESEELGGRYVVAVVIVMPGIALVHHPHRERLGVRSASDGRGAGHCVAREDTGSSGPSTYESHDETQRHQGMSNSHRDASEFVTHPLDHLLPD